MTMNFNVEQFLKAAKSSKKTEERYRNSVVDNEATRKKRELEVKERQRRLEEVEERILTQRENEIKLKKIHKEEREKELMKEIKERTRLKKEQEEKREKVRLKKEQEEKREKVRLKKEQEEKREKESKRKVELEKLLKEKKKWIPELSKSRKKKVAEVVLNFQIKISRKEMIDIKESSTTNGVVDKKLMAKKFIEAEKRISEERLRDTIMAIELREAENSFKEFIYSCQLELVGTDEEREIIKKSKDSKLIGLIKNRIRMRVTTRCDSFMYQSDQKFRETIQKQRRIYMDRKRKERPEEIKKSNERRNKKNREQPEIISALRFKKQISNKK